MTDKYELARTILAAEINRRQDELIALEAIFAEMGGSFDGDDDEIQPKQKLLPGPRQKSRAGKRSSAKQLPPHVTRGPTTPFTINGKSIEMNERHRNVLELIQGAGGEPVSKSDLVGCFAGRHPNLEQTKKTINSKLEVAGVHVVNVYGAGWKLEKLPG
jgi:hypothetical protein